MQRFSLLGRNGNISVLWQKAVLRRNVFTTDDRDQEEKIMQPVEYTLQRPSNSILSKVGFAYNHWLKVPEDKFNLLKEIVHNIHHSQILIDDIQDNSILRRGIPVAHSVYGVPSTLNNAIYLLLKGLEMIQTLNQPDAITVCTEQLLEFIYATGLEIWWRDNSTCPSLEEYKQMIQRKGGDMLYRIVLMQILSDNKTDFSKLNSILTMYFQIRDDYCNLFMQKYTDERGYCDDISEGKFSFPIIHAIRSHPDDHQVINILQQRTQDVELKKYCCSLLEKFGSFSYTRRTLEELDAEARDEIAKHGGNPVLEKVLNDLLTWKNDRDDKNTEQ